MPDSLQKAEATARVRARMPMFLFRRFVMERPHGELFYLEIVWLPRGRWRRSDYSASGRWRPIAIGPFILAYRVVF